LGVDDWAWKKRDRYGTVLVDLTNRKIIDLLNDREASTLEKWLKNNPGVVIISRDRYGKYIQGATNGAPHAMQVADRWHLLKNLGEAVRKQLDREYSVLKELRDEVIAENKFHNDHKSARYQIVKNIRTDRYRDRFRAIKQLYVGGQSVLSIAKKFKMSRQTVRKYIAIDSLPKKISYNQLDKHLLYIRERLLQEPRLQLRNLWHELQQQGYTGAYTTLSESLKKAGVMMGKKSKFNQFPKLSDLLWTPSKASILFFKDVDALSIKQKNTLVSLCEKSPTLTKALQLVRHFRFLMKTKAGNQLNEWILQAIDSGLKEIGGFAQSMKPDFQAIQNAFNLPWSNGPVEGNVNKIKTLKRQMYGRAGFELLKRRLLLNSE
jgi:transposase